MNRLIPTNKGRKLIRNVVDKNPHLYAMEKNKLLHSDLEIAYDKFKPKNKRKKFQNNNKNSLIIYDNNSKIYTKKGSIPNNILTKLYTKHPKANVLVDLGNGLFKSIPINVYKKLTKIKFIILHREYEFLLHMAEYMSEDEWIDSEPVISNIYSINELLKIIAMEESFDLANSHYLSAKFYSLVSVDKTFKILYKNNKVKEMSYSDFIHKYKLDN